ncbi:MAG: hypothetical protein JO030_01420, partial [Candidatus Eremiobacteraeota bacterium]|nr:hypothetical protein [Candidatus Eremiobacteraeota bacterium]
MSRGSILAMLVAAELVVVSVAIYSLGGTATLAGRMHRVAFAAAPLAPLSLGTAPHIVIDDEDSRVHVGVSSDGQVHVRDLTKLRGFNFSNAGYPQLRVTRTDDGAFIQRAKTPSATVNLIGFSTEAIEVNVPAGSRIEIVRCAGADVTGIT